LLLEEKRLVGIFSERDYAKKVILKGKSSKSTTVGELMSSPPICGCPEFRIRDYMALMTDKRIRHLPIVKQGAILGVVSLGDVVKMVVSEQDSLIQTLENYVTDTDYRARVYCP
jgi:CBS domain-containing protein